MKPDELLEYAAKDPATWSKDEVRRLLREAATAITKQQQDAERWRYGARHGFPVLSNLFRQDNQAAWGICVIAGTTHVSDTPEEAIDAAMAGANKNSSTPTSHNTEG